MGPVDASVPDNLLDVGPHPHIGLATLTYLFSGASVHRDSTGVEQVIRPGEVNFMVAGRGVVHSERATEAVSMVEPDAKGRRRMHGMQMWVALPRELEHAPAAFYHVPADDVPDVAAALRPPTATGSLVARLLLGELGAHQITGAPMPWPCFMLALDMAAGTHVSIPVPPGHEACVYVAEGRAKAGTRGDVLDVGEASVYSSSNGDDQASGESTQASSSSSLGVMAVEPSNVVVFGGLPLPEARHIFWNFVGSDKAAVAEAASAWAALDRSRFPPVANESNDDSIALPGQPFLAAGTANGAP